MSVKTVYVREQDRSLWDEFEAQAERRKVSVSSLLAEVVRFWLDQQDFKVTS